MVRISGINLDDIRSGRPLVDTGRWRSKLIACEQGESNAGNPMLIWDWEIAEGPSKGMEARSWTVLVDDAMGNFKTHMEAFGYAGELDADTDELIGKYAVLVIGRRKYRDDNGNEKENTDVVTVLPDDRASEPSTAKSSGGASKGLTIGGGGSRPAARRPSNDTDLPF